MIKIETETARDGIETEKVVETETGIERRTDQEPETRLGL